MLCINADLTKTQSLDLLTKAEKIKTLNTLFGHKFINHGKLFIPPDKFYPQGLVDDEQLDFMATTTLRWLGVKHASVEVVFSDRTARGEYTHIGSKHRISIPHDLQSEALACASVLAHQLMHYYLVSKKRIILSEENENEIFTDLAIIYSGLGSILLNGMDHPSASVIEELRLFTDTHSVSPAVLSLSTTPQLIKRMGKRQRSIKKIHPYFAYLHDQSIQHIKKLLLVFISLLLIIAAAYFVWLQRPRSLPAELQNQKETIDILHSQYERCAAEVTKKQAALDMTDIFMVRRVEADQTRCKSIKNQYNYEVDKYNQNILSL
jgi:hypothetical protein